MRSPTDFGRHVINKLATIDRKLRHRARRTKRRVLIGAETGLWALGRIGLSPVAMLDALSRAKGDKDVRRVAIGASYGDEARQKLDVWVPKAPGFATLPVVVFFYGGGWVAGDRGEFGFVGRALAQRGFVTVLPDYRLSPHAKFPDFVRDGAAALKWVRDHIADLGGDPDRVAVAGHSAGGHLAALLALDPSWLKDEGVDPRTVKAAALLSAPTNFLPFVDPRAIAALGGYEPAFRTQPIHYARGDAPPVLLQTGTSDLTVRCRNSQQLAQALRSQDADVTLKLYRGAVHSDPIKAFSPLFGRYPVVEDLVDWLRAKL